MLCDVYPPEGKEAWPEESADFFCDLINVSSVIMRVKGAGSVKGVEPVKDKPYQVELLFEDTKESASSLLTGVGMAGPSTSNQPQPILTPVVISPSPSPTPEPPTPTPEPPSTSATPKPPESLPEPAEPTPEPPEPTPEPKSPAPKKLCVQPAVVPGVGESFLCRVVHVNSTSSFYITRASGSHQLTSALTDLALEGGRADVKWEAGQVALGLYGDEWCRVKYLHRLDTDYFVYFLDYGNHATVTTLTPLPASLSTLPAQAIQCGLKEQSDNTDLFCNRVYNKVMQATVKVRGDLCCTVIPDILAGPPSSIPQNQYKL